MRHALATTIGPRRRNVPRWRAQMEFMPAPVGGWDTETPVEELPLTKAFTFTNWVTKGQAVEVRKGYTNHVTGFGAAVESLLPYNSASGGALFAAAGTSVYDVSSPGAVGAAVLSSMGNARFSSANFNNSAGSFLWICNGSATPRHWNGTVWTAPSLSITTYASTDIFYVFTSKQRLFVLFKNTLTFGYLGVDSISGTVTNFALGSVFNMGGHLVAGANLSRDGGAGLNDFSVFLTSEGEIAVYQGINPSDATDWGLVGVYYVGEPVGDRPIVQLGGDIGVITRNGFISVGKVMSGVTASEADIMAVIATPFRAAISNGAGFNGWEGLLIPAENLLLINAPVSDSTAEQYVRNAQTGGPGLFTDWDFETFDLFLGSCYAGTSAGAVVKCFNGYSDNGADVTAAFDTAWSRLGVEGVKTLMELHPVLTVATTASMRVVGRVDYNGVPSLPAYASATVTNALIWGTGIWGTNVWGGEDITAHQWRAISGEGYHLSLSVEVRANQGRFAVNGFNIRFATGGQV